MTLTSQPIRLSTNFMTLIPSFTFTDYEWFPWSIFATGVACQQGTLTLPDTWFRPPLWDLLMLQLLRPDSSNLPCLYSTFHLEYPLVLSRFCSLVYFCLHQSSPFQKLNEVSILTRNDKREISFISIFEKKSVPHKSV